MTLRALRYVFYLTFICLFPLVGCAGNSRPKVLPDKDIKAEKKSVIADYFQKLAVTGCDTGKKIKDVSGALKDYREKMKLHYGFFLDSKGYKGEEKILDSCSSISAIDRFFEVFWFTRDPDRSTPENENRKLIDSRISDIENEILLRDQYVPGMTFAHNGGFRGDLAHVYLFRGNSHYKVKTLRTNRLADLMAWIYFDQNDRPVYVFLFYNKGTGFQLFRNFSNFDTVDSLLQTLKELAKIHPTSDEDFNQLYQELVDNDQEYIFRFAIKRFSAYSDVKLEEVLAPPTPESMTAKAIQPKVLGVPNVPSGVKMMMSEYFAKIPGFSRLTRSLSGEYNLGLVISIANIDWEDAGDKLKSSVGLTISITNEKTREKKYFEATLNLSVPADKYSKLYFPIRLDNVPNYDRGLEGTTLSDLFKTLAPGDYEVKISLLNQITPMFSLKSGIWYEYITINK